MATGTKQGIGGWLAFFILTLGLISPTLVLGRTALAMRDPSWASLPVTGSVSFGTALWVINVGGSIIGCCLAVLMLTLRRRATIWVVIGGMWCVALLDILLRGLVMDAAYGTPPFTLLRNLTLHQFRPLIFCTVWTAYLLRSQRVAQTYRREPIGASLEEVFR